jgi:diadenylate cyclase
MPPLPAFGWRDVVDVVLVAAILYRIFVMFRGTRAVQMLVGLAVIIVATLVARRLELRTLNWILDDFWSFWVIALVVLFQSELRQALTRMGQGRLVQAVLGASREERAHVVDEIAGAVEALAVRRTGALIVVERATGLRHYAELGVGLDALVSADLLVSIFQPSSPLHDGAVLVQGSRVVAAACFLPLSRNPHIGRALGTRHRAALGITEEADAVAVAVSEETGRVSITVEGHMESFAEAEKLGPRLHRLLAAGDDGSRRSAFVRGMRRLMFRAPDRA